MSRQVGELSLVLAAGPGGIHPGLNQVGQPRENSSPEREPASDAHARRWAHVSSLPGHLPGRAGVAFQEATTAKGCAIATKGVAAVVNAIFEGERYDGGR
jgi:hypothetical protein